MLLPLNVKIHIENGSKSSFSPITCSLWISLQFKYKIIQGLYLSSWCLVIVIGLLFILMVPWTGLQCVIVVFRDHTHLLLLWVFFLLHGYNKSKGQVVQHMLCSLSGQKRYV